MAEVIGFKDFKSDLHITHLSKEKAEESDFFWKDCNLVNPYGRAACLILTLFNMDFGHFTLSDEVIKASKNMDQDLLPMIGPFVRAYNVVAGSIERNRNDRV